MKRLANYLLFTVLLAILTACAQFGLNAPKTPEDSLRYGQAIVTGAANTLTQSVKDGSMTGPEARTYYDRIVPLKKDLDDADTVISALPNCGTVPATTVGKINAALIGLNLIADQLRARLPPAKTAALPPKQ